MTGFRRCDDDGLDKIKDYVSDKEDQIAKMPFYTKTSEFGMPLKPVCVSLIDVPENNLKINLVKTFPTLLRAGTFESNNRAPR